MADVSIRFEVAVWFTQRKWWLVSYCSDVVPSDSEHPLDKKGNYLSSASPTEDESSRTPATTVPCRGTCNALSRNYETITPYFTKSKISKSLVKIPNYKASNSIPCSQNCDRIPLKAFVILYFRLFHLLFEVTSFQNGQGLVFKEIQLTHLHKQFRIQWSTLY